MKLKLPNQIEKEERVCAYLLPTKILLTTGKVEMAEALLKKPAFLQVSNIRDPENVLLDNRDSSEHAGILMDFGREIVGGARILCTRHKGAAFPRMRLSFGESASEAMATLGVKNAGCDHAMRDFVVTVPAMSDQTWGQTAFRFLYIELLDENVYIELKNIVAAFLYRDLPYLGSFRCDDELLNRIFDTSAYTCHLCMQSLLWDGVKRDRLVWVGDTYPEMLTIRSVFGKVGIIEKSMTQATGQAPLPQWLNNICAYSLWWLLILRDWYRYTGSKAYLNKNRKYVEDLTRQVLGCMTPDGDIHLPSDFLDWPNHNKPAEKDGVRALCVLGLDAAGDLLALYGDSELSKDAFKAAESVREKGGDSLGSKSTASLLYLAGMVSEERTREDLLRGGAHGMTTFMSYYILTALAATGKMNDALDQLRTYYGGMLSMGATTFWETFYPEWTENASPIDRLPREGEVDIHGDYGEFCYVGFRHSLCHGWASGPAPFLLERVLGISFTEPGGSEITVSPDLGNLKFAEGTYPLPDGKVLFVRAEREKNGKINVTYRAPEGVRVTCKTKE